MKTFCGTDYCDRCGRLSACGGCQACGGCPMGGVCVAAEIVREGGPEALEREKQALVDEINALGMKELRLQEIHFIGGFIGNLDYPLMGKSIQFLRENDIYFGTQVERSDGLCYGIVADREYLIVSEYGAEGANPRLLLVKFRGA